MQTDSRLILDAALKLPEGERVELVSLLLESLPDVDGILSLDNPDLIEELDRRSKDLSPGIPWEQIRAEKL